MQEIKQVNDSDNRVKKMQKIGNIGRRFHL